MKGPFGSYLPVPGSSGRASIFQVSGSPYWYLYTRLDGRTVRRSTGCVEQDLAFEFARAFLQDLEIGAKVLPATSKAPTFAEVAGTYLAAEQNRASLGEVSERSIYEEGLKLRSHIFPVIGCFPIDMVGKAAVNDCLLRLHNERGVRTTTRNKYLVVIRKVLKHAWEAGIIPGLPSLPSSRRDDRPRDHFTHSEVATLVSTLQRLVSADEPIRYMRSGRFLRYIRLDQDIVDYVVFAVNSFVRPSDLKLLRHGHIRFHNEDETEVLLIDPVRSKTVRRLSMTMPRAAEVYRALLRRRIEEGIAHSSDDYVFLPTIPNRTYALAEVRRLFDHALNLHRMKRGANGTRTLYSLRHTAFVDRLVNSNIDPMTLALNGLTSVEMLQRHYLSHVDARLKFGAFIKSRQPSE
ncbi:hypothetical protein FHR70_003510 [Microvirga lupini]|uniref:Tyr recombinase domain-containing protein n=1 Tax=Microvirga lupini TaxID=420324 RepID=A0A7W4VNH3_9HYPH|nr:hypothetical protein [Microvirga lupini]MBB3020429.1 hypothetical protein [Microvirga lupini]